MAVGDIVPLDNGGQLSLGILSQLQNNQANDQGALVQMAQLNAQRQSDARRMQMEKEAQQQAYQQQQQQDYIQQQQMAMDKQQVDKVNMLQQNQMNRQKAASDQRQALTQQMTDAFMAGDKNTYESLLAVNMPDSYNKYKESQSKIVKNLIGNDQAVSDLDAKNLENFKTRSAIGAQLAQAIIKNPQLHDHLAPILQQVDPTYDPTKPDENYLVGMAMMGEPKSSAFQDNLKKQGATDYTKLSAGIPEYNKSLEGFNQLLGMADKITTGPDPLNFRKTFKSAFGMEGAKYDAIVKNIINPLALAQRQNMPGSLSDNDIKFLLDGIVNPTKGKAGFIASAQYGMAVAQASKDYAVAKMQWLSQDDGDIQGFDDAWSQSDAGNKFSNTLKDLRASMDGKVPNEQAQPQGVPDNPFADTFK